MLDWDISPGPEGIRARLRGSITERTAFDDLDLDGDRLTLIADGVRYINSTGLQRLWAFLKPLAERCAVAVERCSPALVTQLNLMPALAGCLSVRSVIAPLECSECVAETDVLIEVPEGSAAPPIPARPCEVCGAPMELAELEERYFAFLAPSS